MAFSFNKFMRGLASGSDSGLGSFAKPYVEVKTQDALNKGIGQIQEGDWNGGISTIGEWSPDTALGLAQYKQKQDDAFALQQMKDEARNQITPYQQEMLALKRQQLAQGGDNNPFSGNNEFIRLLAIKNNPDIYNNLPDDQKALIDARLNYMSNNPDNTFDISYQRKAGSLQAEKEGKQEEQIGTAETQAGNIDNLISDIQKNKDLLGIYSAPRAGIARLTFGRAGYNPEQLEKRGSMIRQLGEIQNSIIQKARAAGQVGINTISEIRQATKGIDENTSAEEIIGALQYMKEKEQDLINRMRSQRRNQSVRPQQNIDYSNASDDDILQGLR